MSAKSHFAFDLEPDFRLLFESTPTPYLVLTPEFIIVAANEERLLATMTTREQILGRPLFEAFPDNPSDPQATGVTNLRASLLRVLEKKAPDAMPIQKYDIPLHGSVEKGFEVRYWKPLNSPVFNAAGELTYILHCVEDVTDHVLKQQAVEQSEARFRQIANSVPQIVWSTLADGFHDYYNQQYYDFTGVPIGSTTGHEWSKVYHPDDLGRTQEAWQHCLATGEPFEIEYRMRHHSGQYRWTLGRALPIRNETGEIVRWMGTCTDIHEQKAIQDALLHSEQKFRLLYGNAPIGIAHINLEGRWTYANQKLAEITGYTPEEIVALSYLDVTPPEERAVSMQWTKKLLAGECDIHRERTMLRKDGSVSWIRLTARMLLNEKGEPQYGIAIFEDINDRKQTEAALQESEERFRTTFENAPLGIMEATFDGRFVNANPKMLELLGYSLEEFRQLTYIDITHPADMEQTLSNFQKLVSGQATSYVSEKRYIRKDGSFVWIKVTTALRQAGGVPKYVIGIVGDITSRRRAEEDLRQALEHSYHLANHDALTGLANRAKFNERLADALCYAKRDGHLVAVHLLDLDRFKTINDTLGHHMGDLLLKEVASRLRSMTRDTDVVARLGGDEFVIIQTHLATPAAAGILAEKVRKELRRVFVLDGQEVNSGTSIGIALFPNHAATPEQMVKLADLALYDAKSRGRYNFQFYREEMGTAAAKAEQFELELRQALYEEQFCLHYQPQFDLQSGSISGVEVFLRWQHLEKGLLMAADFIHEVENTGMMPLIGEWVLNTACRQHRKWASTGLNVPLVLNVSLQQLQHPNFLQTLKKALDESKLPPSLIQLEACESVLWNSKISAHLFEQLKAIGVRLALDDFGAEFAALSSLYRFPLDVVKPGRRLVNKLSRNEQESAVLTAVVSIAHKLNISVCAEGVETADELTAIKEHGCNDVQGFLLSSPVSEKVMDQLIMEGALPLNGKKILASPWL